MRRFGLAALTVVALTALWLPSTGGGVLTTESPAPSYMSGLGNRFTALSSNAYRAAGKKAKELTVYNTSNNLNKPAGAKQERYTSIWASTCDPRKDQLVRFRRDIDIPGPPSSVNFEISPDFSGFSPRPLRYELEINGKVLTEGKLKVPNTKRVALTEPGPLKAFKDGENEIELRVKRQEFPEYVRGCNTSKKNRLAVYFTLGGEFASDLGLVEPPPKSPVYYKATVPQYTLTIGLQVFNRGPSATVDGMGTFTANINADFVGVKAAPPPFKNCRVTGTRVDCELSQMPSADSGNLSLFVRKDFSNTNFAEQTSVLSWRSTLQGNDPNFDNNNRSVTIVWCGSQATSDGCASAQ